MLTSIDFHMDFWQGMFPHLPDEGKNRHQRPHGAVKWKPKILADNFSHQCGRSTTFLIGGRECGRSCVAKLKCTQCGSPGFI